MRVCSRTYPCKKVKATTSWLFALQLQNYFLWSWHLPRTGLWESVFTFQGPAVKPEGRAWWKCSLRHLPKRWSVVLASWQLVHATTGRHQATRRNSGRPQPLSILQTEWVNRAPTSGLDTSKLNSRSPCWLCDVDQVPIYKLRLKILPRGGEHDIPMTTTELSPPREFTPGSNRIYITKVTLSVEDQNGTTP